MPGKTILVIDTDIETEEQIMSTMEAAGYLVFAAQTDDVVSVSALKVNPSLMFFSASEAGSSGIEGCRIIHEMEAFRNVPIIVLTPYDEKLEPDYASRYGIADIIRMPFSPQDLLHRVEAVLSGKAPESAETATEAAAAPPKAEAVSGAAPDETPFLDEVLQKAADMAPPAASPPAEEGPREPLLPDLEYKPVRPTRRRKAPHLLSPALIIACIVVIAGAGLFLFRDLLFKPSAPPPPVKKAQPLPPKTVAQNAPTPAAPEQPKPTAPETKPTVAPQQKPAAAASPSVAATPARTASPTPAGAASPTPAAAGKTGHAVQLGAFRDGNRAEALAKQFRDKGYNAFVRKTETKEKGVLYRVLIGPFADRKESMAMLERLRSKEKITAVPYHD